MLKSSSNNSIARGTLSVAHYLTDNLGGANPTMALRGLVDKINARL